MKDPYTCSACKYAKDDMCVLTGYKPTFEERYEERPKICPWSNTANKSPTFTCELVGGYELDFTEMNWTPLEKPITAELLKNLKKEVEE